MDTPTDWDGEVCRLGLEAGGPDGDGRRVCVQAEAAGQ